MEYTRLKFRFLDCLKEHRVRVLVNRVQGTYERLNERGWLEKITFIKPSALVGLLNKFHELYEIILYTRHSILNTYA
jgi:hypothetical protein